MRRTIILATTLIVIVVIAAGYLGYSNLNGNQLAPTTTNSPTPQVSPTPLTTPTSSPTASPSPEPTFTNQEQIRDAVMSYIKTQYNQTVTYMHDFMWNGGMISNGMMVGSSTYSYQSNGWNVTMQYPITQKPIYTITANYTSPISEMFPPQNMITWTGTWQNGTITETNYSFTP